MDKLTEGLENCKYAIELDKNYAHGYANLSLIYYALGNLDSALEEVKKANSMDPKSSNINKLLAVMRSKKNNQLKNSGVKNLVEKSTLINNPLILFRQVEFQLVERLYQLDAIELGKIKDPSFGNAKGSDYNLFNDKSSEIINIALDLENILLKNFGGEIFIIDSFYTILGAGGGVERHNHLSGADSKSCIELDIKKYSLVYYLRIGDQKCSHPGILKLFEPSEDILPLEGMIIIFPADRDHSAIYNGLNDRVIIGVNFYVI